MNGVHPLRLTREALPEAEQLAPALVWESEMALVWVWGMKRGSEREWALV